MKTLLAALAVSLCPAIAFAAEAAIGPAAEAPVITTPATDDDEQGWVELFNGKDFTGWKATETPGSFTIDDGKIVANGERSHLFYVGPVGGADFKDFVCEVEVMLAPNSNSGVFFHTKVQDVGWPTHGYEAQLNNTQKDPRKTASIYAVQDIMDTSPAEDNEWFKMRVTVRGKRVQVHVNGKLLNDYTEPADVQPPANKPNRQLSSGTIALQGHDPGSTVSFRSIRLKLLEPATTVGPDE